MSFEITTAFVNQYNANLALLSQQRQSKFQACVRNETQNSEYQYYDRIGPVEAQPRGPRHSDTPLMSTPHDRRRVTTNPYNWADLIDTPDRVRTIIQPDSPYATNAVMAFNRTTDDIIIQAGFGVAQAGKNGELPIPFPQTQIVPVDYVESGAAADSGLTIAKLRRARRMFMDADVDDSLKLYWATSPAGIQNLLQSEEVTNSDYAAIKALVYGEVNTFMGFTFIWSTRMPLKEGTTNVRKNLVWAQDGILLATGTAIRTKITERDDKNYSTQVYVEMDKGAVRMEEVKVVEVDCLEPN